MAFKPGEGGRKKGSKNRKTILMQELEKDGSALGNAIRVAALSGDVGAMNLWVSRLEPPAKHPGARVEFEFDKDATPAQNISKVLEAVSSGQLTIEQGEIIVNALEKLATARAALEVVDKEAELIAAFKDMATKLPV